MGLTYNNDQGELINYEELSDKDILIIILKKLINENKYNEAEDTLFDKVDEIPLDIMKEVGEWFYSTLMKKSDEDLLKGNFSRGEILQGREDLMKILI